MSRTFHKRPPKHVAGPDPSVAGPLEEVFALLLDLRAHFSVPTEVVIQTSLKKTFGTLHKAYGSIIALRNALKNAKRTVYPEAP